MDTKCQPQGHQLQAPSLTLRSMATRVKRQLWPSVPDPANSSLGKWMPAELQEVSPRWLLPLLPHSPPLGTTKSRA